MTSGAPLTSVFRAAPAVTIRRGLAAGQAVEAAALFYETFRAKLSFWPALPRDRARAVALIAGCVEPACVYAALKEDGAVVGVAFAGVRLLRPDLTALRAAYGSFGASWRRAAARALSGALRERGVIHLDGFTVAPTLRNAGIGSAMLRRIVSDARRGGGRALVLSGGPRRRPSACTTLSASATWVRLARDRFGAASTTRA